MNDYWRLGRIGVRDRVLYLRWNLDNGYQNEVQ
jgi:hypothetical protein